MSERTIGIAAVLVLVMFGAGLHQSPGRLSPLHPGPLPLAVAPAVEVAPVSQIAAVDLNWVVGVVGYGPEEEVFAADHIADAGKKVEWPESLTAEQLDHVYDLADVPHEWRADLAAIAVCESKLSPGAIGDSGNSLGLHQLDWQTWFAHALGLGIVVESEREQWADPVVNSRVALGVIRYDVARGYAPFLQWTCQP